MIIRSILLYVSVYTVAGVAIDVAGFDITSWSVEQGVTFHPEKINWRKAANICRKNNGHLITVDCGEKQKHVREYLKIKNVNDSVWIGLNSAAQGQGWKWDSSDSSVNSYRNFYNGQNILESPNTNTCVIMRRY